MDKTDKNTIEELLPRYCEGLATEEERLQVEMWMDESEENRRMAKQIHALYLATDTVHIMTKVDTEENDMVGMGATCGSSAVHSTSRYSDGTTLGRKRTGIGTNDGSENKSRNDDFSDIARWHIGFPEFRIYLELSLTLR